MTQKWTVETITLFH